MGGRGPGRYRTQPPMSPRGSQKTGTELLVEHVRALDARHDPRPPLARLTEALGERLALMLVAALTGDHSQRRRVA